MISFPSESVDFIEKLYTHVVDDRLKLWFFTPPIVPQSILEMGTQLENLPCGGKVELLRFHMIS